MAIPIWPLDLPQKVLRSNYKETFPNNTIRYEPDSGISKVRRKSGLTSWPLSVTLLLTKAQKELLEEFVEDTLSMGSLRFSFPHPTKCISVEVRIVAEQDALFAFTPVGPFKFNVTLNLEVLP